MSHQLVVKNAGVLWVSQPVGKGHLWFQICPCVPVHVLFWKLHCTLNDCNAIGWNSGMDCLRFCWTVVGSYPMVTEVTPSHGKMNCLTWPEVASLVATAFPQGTLLRFHTSGHSYVPGCFGIDPQHPRKTWVGNRSSNQFDKCSTCIVGDQTSQNTDGGNNLRAFAIQRNANNGMPRKRTWIKLTLSHL